MAEPPRPFGAVRPGLRSDPASEPLRVPGTIPAERPSRVPTSVGPMTRHVQVPPLRQAEAVAELQERQQATNFAQADLSFPAGPLVFAGSSAQVLTGLLADAPLGMVPANVPGLLNGQSRVRASAEGCATCGAAVIDGEPRKNRIALVASPEDEKKKKKEPCEGKITEEWKWGMVTLAPDLRKVNNVKDAGPFLPKPPEGTTSTDPKEGKMPPDHAAFGLVVIALFDWVTTSKRQCEDGTEVEDKHTIYWQIWVIIQPSGERGKWAEALVSALKDKNILAGAGGDEGPWKGKTLGDANLGEFAGFVGHDVESDGVPWEALASTFGTEMISWSCCAEKKMDSEVVKFAWHTEANGVVGAKMEDMNQPAKVITQAMTEGAEKAAAKWNKGVQALENSRGRETTDGSGRPAVHSYLKPPKGKK